MGKFALQKSPCSFLKLRISPWGNMFILLLCFFSPRHLYPFSILTGSTSLLHSYPLPLSPFLLLHAVQAGGRGSKLGAAKGGPSDGSARRRRRWWRRRSRRRRPEQSGYARALGRAEERLGRARAAAAAAGPSGERLSARAAQAARRGFGQRASPRRRALERARLGTRVGGGAERLGGPAQE
jgi:hypothetical protein